MRCPYCRSEELKVVDKRDSEDDSIRRRRECIKCSKRFTTYERVLPMDLFVVKSDGKREAFSEEKKGWRTDKEFCLDAPLKSIGL